MEHLSDEMKSSVLKRITEFLKGEMSENRFFHTLGVKDEITRMGEIYLQDEIFELQIAALLHDITKEYSVKKQLQLCERYGIILDNGDLRSPQVIHSLTGAYVAYEKFPELVTPKIAGAIYKHTLASEDMSLFDKLLFVSDFTESGRTNDFCVNVRNKFWQNISKCASYEEKVHLLDEIILFSLDSTISKLLKSNSLISLRTVKARNKILETFSSDTE